MNARISLLVLAFLALLSSGTGGVLFYVYLSETAAQDAARDADQTARMLARQTSLHLDRLGKSTATLSHLPQVQEALRDGGKALERANAILDDYCTTLGASICYLMDRTGTLIASSNRRTAANFAGRNYAFRPYFSEPFKGKPTVYMALGVTTGERGIYHGSPVVGADGTILGVAVIKGNIEAVENEFRNLPGIVTLSDRTGVVFASNKPAWQFHTLGRLSPDKAAGIRESRQYGDKDLETIGMETPDAYRATLADGSAYIVGRQAIDTLPDWRITYFLDNRKIALELKGEGYWVAYGFGGLFILTGLAVIALFRIGTRDITHRQAAERALERRSELETLLASISSDFISGDAGVFHAKVVHTLMALGQFTETDRVVLFVRPPSSQRLILEAEWSASGIKSRLTSPPSYDEDEMPWLVSQLKTLNTVHIPTLSGLPPEAGKERDLLKSLDVLSSLSVPLVLRGVFAGFVGFHTTRAERRWPQEDIRMLATAAEILSFALDRERIEGQLRKLSLAIEQSPVSVVMTDRNGIIEFANRQFSVVSGYTPAEAVGRSPSFLKSGRVPDDVYRDLWHTITSGKVWRGELLNRRKDGELYWEAVLISPMTDNNGTISHFIGIKEDITELKRVSHELERSNAELEQFCYAISHDLQQPLRMVTSYLQLLDKQYSASLDPMAKDFIGFAVDGGQRMQRMIRDLLEYSRVNTQGTAPVPCDSDAALQDALANLTVAIRDAKAEVDVSPMPTVIADMGQLERLFQNLIGNAIKYHAPDSPPHVNISAERSGREWTFAIKDNGIGIDEKHFDRVFELFQRLHKQSTFEGTGVGLALCRRIVEHHGGRIWLESKPGHGSTFFFTLPGIETVGDS